MPQEDQPGVLRVNRANILRRIGRVCFASGDQPGLPAPDRVEFTPSLALYFDSLAEASQWATRYDLHGRISRIGEIRQIVATGQWEGVDIGVLGWSKDGPAPADTDPDDLSHIVPTSALHPPAPLAAHYDASAYANEFVCACGANVGDPLSLQAHIAAGNADVPLVDSAARAAEDGNGDPVPAEVDGFTHKRGQPGWAHEPSGEQPIVTPDLTFTSTSQHGGALRQWDLTGPAGYLRFEIAEALGLAAASVYVRPAGWDTGTAEPDTLVGTLARKLHEEFLAAGEEQVIRTQLEVWYGEHLAGGDAR
jgi:hypothetical protein